MSRIAVVGAGHVGVVYAAGLAELGHEVVVVDVDARRIELLGQGKVWFYEPGLPELLERNLRRGRIAFTTRHQDALAGAEFAFVCVPTPSTEDGSLDDSYLRAAFDDIRTHMGAPAPIVVNKSTVPVGTGDLAASLFENEEIRVVSNPEFLSEGRALEDFFHPTRIVIGARDADAVDRVAALYAPLRATVVKTDPVTAELSKLAANAFLATKISFANVLSRIVEAVHADGDSLTRALSLDPRIGPGHLRPGLGFGGSCLPKDLAAMEQLARRTAASPELFAAVASVNRTQRARVVGALVDRFGSLGGKRIAILGVSFKAHTDDTRESPAVALAYDLARLHASVQVYDPEVRWNGARVAGVEDARSVLAAARDADALVVATDWPEFGTIDLGLLRRTMRGDLLVDGRGIVDRAAAVRAGFTVFTLDGARSPVRA